MGQKRTFILNKEWRGLIKTLPDEKAGQLFKAIYDLVEAPEEEIVFNDAVMDAIFIMVKDFIVSNEKKYLEKCEKNAENARKHKASKDEENEKERTQANASERNKSQANENDGERNVTDTSLSLSLSLSCKKIIEYLNLKTGKHYRPNSRTTKELIQARLNEGYTEDDLITVIDNKVDDWLGNPDMEKYLAPETIFCAKHFEKYLNQKARAKPKVVKMPEPPQEEISDEEFFAMVDSGFGEEN